MVLLGVSANASVSINKVAFRRTQFVLRWVTVCGRLRHLRVKKPGFFLKAQPSGFYWVLLGFGVLLGFLDKQEKIGKIIQKLSNSKP